MKITIRNTYCPVTVGAKTSLELLWDELEYEYWVNLRKKWPPWDESVQLKVLKAKTTIEANKAYLKYWG